MLTQIAFLVNKYDLLEITHFLARGWLSGIKHTTPTEINYDLLAWIYIAEIFKEKTISQNVQKVAIFESEGLLNAFDLPIDAQILGLSFTNGQTVYY